MQRPHSMFLTLSQIESKVCDIASVHCGIKRSKVFPESRIIQDLHCDSLDLVELIMTIEDEFDVALPDDPPHLAYKQVFTRSPFRLRDLAELVYLQQGCGHIPQKSWWADKASLPARAVVPFLQLSGRATPAEYATGPLYSAIGKNDEGFETFRRCTDGMPCVLIPGAEVTLGSVHGNLDEQPVHRVDLQSFLMDQEPVSTSAYCRFLNSIGAVDPTILEEWFVLTADDKRREHELICCKNGTWSPLPGVERFPMILVSWYGAAAYARWANRRGWLVTSGTAQDMASEFLPSEAQWEYAARGAEERTYPWGDAPATASLMRYACHRRGATYTPQTLPLANVNEPLGVSPFGLIHMAGNIWQWCRDWYAHSYETAAPINSNVKSERGGSWIGPDFLCRCSYRRGRAPAAKGRCLGFRCVGALS